jgi:hypothetical protein
MFLGDLILIKHWSYLFIIFIDFSLSLFASYLSYFNLIRKKTNDILYFII